MRSAAKARGASIPSVCERAATPDDEMQRASNAAGAPSRADGPRRGRADVARPPRRAAREGRPTRGQGELRPAACGGGHVGCRRDSASATAAVRNAPQALRPPGAVSPLTPGSPGRRTDCARLPDHPSRGHRQRAPGGAFFRAYAEVAAAVWLGRHERRSGARSAKPREARGRTCRLYAGEPQRRMTSAAHVECGGRTFTG